MKTLQKSYLLLFFISFPVLGDILVVQNQGNTVIPQNETEISMDAEIVRVVPLGVSYGYTVFCEFILTNHSDEKVTRTTAFPVSSAENKEYMFEDFKVSIERNGKEEMPKTSLKTAKNNRNHQNYLDQLNYPAYIVWKQTFLAGETQTVRCEYPMGGFLVPSKHPFREVKFEYIVRTGALWKENIKRAEISLCLRSWGFDNFDKITMSYPDNARWESPDKTNVVWRFVDWEPTEDITMVFTRWDGYNTNNISNNGYRLPEPYTGAQKLYTEDDLNRFVDNELQRVAKYYPEYELDKEFIRSMIAQHLFYEMFAHHGDTFILAPYNGEKPFRHLGPMLRDGDTIHSSWYRYFLEYFPHRGWYHGRIPEKISISFDELNPIEQQNAVFLRSFISERLIREVPSEGKGL